MSYPQYPQQQPPQQYPQQQPPQQYPPPQQGQQYAPPQQQYAPPQQQYAPPQQQYPPPNQGYPPPQQQQYAPPPVQARGTIDAFYDQPAASGKSIASWFQTPGQSISGVVARVITNADTRPQTDMQTKQPKYYSDGRPMLTMTIPLIVQPSQDFPDGRAAWIISSSDKEDLDLAMQAAGCAPRSVPEPGAIITITFTGYRQIPGFGAPKKVKQVQYLRPEGSPPPIPPAAAPAAQAPPAAQQQNYAGPNGQAAQDNGSVPWAAGPQQQQYAAPPPQQQQYAAPPPQQQPPPPQQQPPPPQQQPPPPQQQPPPPQPAPMQMPAGLSPEQQAQLAKLTGAQVT